ncbi:MAG: DUF4102 domain-containing protein [Alphaproteobacteria bacterium]|nr:DUF4102 domain-containing protein [Alphaproteobacteria bacterium]MBM4437547.1 DUF4102 domain-containing protein [Actinomycetota bacterium]
MPSTGEAKKLTDTRAKSIAPPAEGRVYIWDAQVPAFGLRVSHTGRKAFVVHYRVKGDRAVRRYTIGTFPLIGVADAREKAQDVLRAARGGSDPLAAEQGERKRRAANTFRAVAALYMADGGKRGGANCRPARPERDASVGTATRELGSCGACGAVSERARHSARLERQRHRVANQHRYSVAIAHRPH